MLPLDHVGAVRHVIGGERVGSTFLRIITQDLHLYCHFNTTVLYNQQGPQLLPGP